MRKAVVKAQEGCMHTHDTVSWLYLLLVRPLLSYSLVVKPCLVPSASVGAEVHSQGRIGLDPL